MSLNYLNIFNLDLIESLYNDYLLEATSLEPSWRAFFDGYQLGTGAGTTGKADARLFAMILTFQTRGHLYAATNPLEALEEELTLESFGFSKEEEGTTFQIKRLFGDKQKTLREIFDFFKKIYSSRIGFQYMHIEDRSIIDWMWQRIEREIPPITVEQRLKILEELNNAAIFEAFLHTKFMGKVRFSLEGHETLIPLIQSLIEKMGQSGVDELMIGMAHRGRLNVLANILKKPLSEIFYEFDPENVAIDFEGSGDAKYHKGYAYDAIFPNGAKVHLHLTPNPSHLESVDPVVLGEARSRQEKKGTKQVLPLLIHGDAALAGQGVVYEILQFNKLEGYTTGGTLHLVLNNQIGFTTHPLESRSTEYCTDIARSFQAPVFHVNVEDVEGCLFVLLLALEIRQTFAIDCFIDLIGYRKYGHNEGDEPSFTQPLVYQTIRNKTSIRDLYFKQLHDRAEVEEGVLQRLEERFKENLHKAFETKPIPAGLPKGIYPHSRNKEDSFQMNENSLASLGKSLLKIPPSFHLHPKLGKIFEERLNVLSSHQGVDWAFAEQLSFASLLQEGVPIRLSGQDCRRGTFSQRHAVLVDQKTGELYFPLQHISKTDFAVYNSPLSEFGVLGFDYGYSLSRREALVIWEAQYGDFCNGAQIIIDQYLAAGEQKWGKRSSIALLLPHGFEGMGPEHSSARMERFLQLAAENNFRICSLTTPAQYFHLLRRQAKTLPEVPLILFTPKSLLRHPLCQSTLSEIVSLKFQELIDDQTVERPSRLVFCTGKIYYELLEEKKNRQDRSTALIRIEQLYPFPVEACRQILDRSKDASLAWVQEEPENMGAWSFMALEFKKILSANRVLEYIGRNRSASPATGFISLHKAQQKEILKRALQG